MSIQDVLQRITSALDQAGIAYMLSGSFASAYYGAARSTQDIDFRQDPFGIVRAMGIYRQESRLLHHSNRRRLKWGARAE